MTEHLVAHGLQHRTGVVVGPRSLHRADPPVELIGDRAGRVRQVRHEERHLSVPGEPVAGALVDFGLFFFHHARRLKKLGLGPCFCLPESESHREARLRHDVFTRADKLREAHDGFGGS